MAPVLAVNVIVAKVPAAVGGVVAPERAKSTCTVPLVLSIFGNPGGTSGLAPSKSPPAALSACITVASNETVIEPLLTPLPAGSTVTSTVKISPASTDCDAGLMLTDCPAATPIVAKENRIANTAIICHFAKLLFPFTLSFFFILFHLLNIIYTFLHNAHLICLSLCN